MSQGSKVGRQRARAKEVHFISKKGRAPRLREHPGEVQGVDSSVVVPADHAPEQEEVDQKSEHVSDEGKGIEVAENVD